MINTKKIAFAAIVLISGCASDISKKNILEEYKKVPRHVHIFNQKKRNVGIEKKERSLILDGEYYKDNPKLMTSILFPYEDEKGNIHNEKIVQTVIVDSELKEVDFKDIASKKGLKITPKEDRCQKKILIKR